MADYGIDVQASDDLPDPEILCSGDTLMAYALARRLLQQEDALQEIGDDTPCDTMDVRDWLGERFDPGGIAAKQTQARLILSQDERVLSVDVQVSFLAGTITFAVQGEGNDGPFSFVLSVDKVSSQLLVGG